MIGVLLTRRNADCRSFCGSTLLVLVESLKSVPVEPCSVVKLSSLSP